MFCKSCSDPGIVRWLTLENWACYNGTKRARAAWRHSFWRRRTPHRAAKTTKIHKSWPNLSAHKKNLTHDTTYQTASCQFSWSSTQHSPARTGHRGFYLPTAYTLHVEVLSASMQHPITKQTSTSLSVGNLDKTLNESVGLCSSFLKRLQGRPQARPARGSAPICSESGREFLAEHTRAAGCQHTWREASGPTAKLSAVPGAWAQWCSCEPPQPPTGKNQVLQTTTTELFHSNVCISVYTKYIGQFICDWIWMRLQCYS